MTDLANDPADLLDSVSASLRELGLTDADLEVLRLRPSPGLRFAEWSIRGGAGNLPLAALPLLRFLCTLKWLIVGDPSISSDYRDKEDGWNYIAHELAAPIYEAGLRAPEVELKAQEAELRARAAEFAAKEDAQSALEAKLKLAEIANRDEQNEREFSEKQRERASKRRITISDDKTMKDIVGRVVRNHPGETARALWPHFLSHMDRLGAPCTEVSKPKGASASGCTYQYAEGERKLSFKSFTNLVSKSRVQSRSP